MTGKLSGQKLKDAVVQQKLDWGRRGILLGVVVALVCGGAGTASVNAASDAPVVKYFFDHPPTDLELSKEAPTGSPLVVAKVKVLSVNWRGNRHGEGGGKTRHQAEVQIIDVLKGDASRATKEIVSFGTPASAQKYIFPRTPAMRAREYFIAYFTDENKDRRLIGLPAGLSEYERWNREFLEFERARNRPGARDR